MRRLHDLRLQSSWRRRILVHLPFAIAALLAACATVPETTTSAALKELAPTGKLRVAIAIATAASPFFAVVDPVTGKPTGVSVDLANELAQSLAVPLELVVYPATPPLLQGALSGAWDVTFLTVDREREKYVDFGPAYYVTESTYLVPANSNIHTIDEVDRAGVKVVARSQSTQAVELGRSLKNATLILVSTVEAQDEALRSGKADAIASGRPGLMNMVEKFPGAHVLEGNFASPSTAVAVPKNRPAALAYVSTFIESAKASGSVRRAVQKAGLVGGVVAPRQ
ncbi:MAG TPA: transporter substrate-binding domain-containing protein [Burkholderiales bacterium]|nr:transporter substrate-binding domain-containing protein [Burkholderiales bacterium]